MSTTASALSGAIAGGASPILGFPLSPIERTTDHPSSPTQPGMSRMLTAPFDVVKVRLQLQVGPIAKSAQRQRLAYQSVWGALRKVAREEGLVGLWRCVLLPWRGGME